jgi:hypothetical protein
MLLSIVLKHKPWAAAWGTVTKIWGAICTEFRNAMKPRGRSLRRGTVQKHVTQLCKKFRVDDRKKRGASGAAEEYTQLDELLQEVSQAFLETKAVKDGKALAVVEDKKKKNDATAEIREQALKTFSRRRKIVDVATLDDVVEHVDAHSIESVTTPVRSSVPTTTQPPSTQPRPTTSKRIRKDVEDSDMVEFFSSIKANQLHFEQQSADKLEIRRQELKLAQERQEMEKERLAEDKREKQMLLTVLSKLAEKLS